MAACAPIMPILAVRIASRPIIWLQPITKATSRSRFFRAHGLPIVDMADFVQRYIVPLADIVISHGTAAFCQRFLRKSYCRLNPRSLIEDRLEGRNSLHVKAYPTNPQVRLQSLFVLLGHTGRPCAHRNAITLLVRLDKMNSMPPNCTRISHYGNRRRIARAIAAQDQELHDSLQVTETVADVQGRKDGDSAAAAAQPWRPADRTATVPMVDK